MTSRIPGTLIDSLEQKVKECPNDVCFYGEGETGWKPYTHRQFHDHVVALSHSLKEQGVGRGDRVGILARPCYEWEVADKAIMYLGATVVGLDHKSSADDLAYVIRAACLKGAFVENGEFLGLIRSTDLSQFSFIYSFAGPTPPCDHLHVHRFWSEVQRQHAGETPVSQARIDDIGVILFSSGTTGKPKGIPLRHSQLTASLPVMYDVFPGAREGGWRTLAWVPLYNGTGRMMGSINYFLGIAQYFLRDPRTLFDKIKEANPTYLVVVPRLLEKLYLQAHASLRAKPRALRLVAQALVKARAGLHAGWVNRVTDQLLVGKLREAIWGKNIQFLISGSAPVEPHILKFFDSLGVPTYEVYGLSEIGVLVSINPPGRQRYGSVGQPLNIVDVAIAPDNEILAKTTAALDGYWGETESDNGLYTEDGYLKTGDLGEFRDGYLYITGRKKEIIKTSTGQRISPAAVEAVYRDVPGIDQVVVVGDGRKYLTALVTLEEKTRCLWEEQDHRVEQYLAKEFDKRHGKLARTRQIKRFVVLPRAFSVAEGEITPTLKVRRSAIEEKHRDLIDSMYEQDRA